MRCTPRAANISPTIDLPLAIPPVRPTFSKASSRECSVVVNTFHHGDTEAQRKPNANPAKHGSLSFHPKAADFRVALCLCVSVVKMMLYRHGCTTAQFGGADGVGHQHRNG